MKNLIALETCTSSGGVSLMIEGRIVGHYLLTTSRSHSLFMCDSIRKLMESASVTWSDIDGIAVSIGPGSFTGVRLGLTLAKGFCLSSDDSATGESEGQLALIPVPTMEAFAHRIYRHQNADYVMPVINARMGEVYGQLFRPDNGDLEKLTEPVVFKPDSLQEFLGERRGRILVAGDGFEDYRPYFDLPDTSWIEADSDLGRPHPDGIAQFVLKRNLSGVENPAEVSPYYLREPSVSTPKNKNMPVTRK